MNLGSPDSTEVKDVRAYLKEFLMDERVIDSPFLARFLLVNGIIAPFRAPKSAHAYKSIWTKEGSPLIVLTKQLQAALQKQITEPVFIAMRYGKPNIKEAYDAIWKNHSEVEEVILLPLYPHYAMSSYETAVVQAQDIYRQGKYGFKIRTIRPYYKHPDYINALAESIKPHLNTDYDMLLFSYHGLPESHLTKGDTTGTHCMKVANCCEIDSPAHSTCYKHQCYTTTRLVAAALGVAKEKYSLSFQSRLGRQEWIKPYTDQTLKDMPAKGIKKLLIVCPAFVSDCLETLEEIAMQGKETFLQAGGESYDAIPCMNVDPAWVSTIAGWMKGMDIKAQELLMVNEI
jgi:protoporphyrin/coproporphyrin ferrochelatase